MKIQIGNDVREMTEEEKTEHKKVFDELNKIELAKEKTLQAQKNIYVKLGLTADEINLLLGL